MVEFGYHVVSQESSLAIGRHTSHDIRHATAVHIITHDANAAVNTAMQGTYSQ